MQDSEPSDIFISEKKIGRKVALRQGPGCLSIIIWVNAGSKSIIESVAFLLPFMGASLMGWAIVRHTSEIMQEIRSADFAGGYAAMAATFSLTIIAVILHATWAVALREKIDIRQGVMKRSRKALWTLASESYEVVYIRHLRIAIPDGYSEIPVRGLLTRINLMDGRIWRNGTLIFDYQNKYVEIAVGIDRLTATYFIQLLNSYGIQ